MRTIILNSSHFVGDNRLEFRFNPSNDKFETGDCIALQSASIYNQFYNISSKHVNNYVDITWNAFQTETRRCWIPDGFYKVSEISLFIQAWLVRQKWYTINEDESINEYIEFQSNQMTYNTQINIFALPVASNINSESVTDLSGNIIYLPVGCGWNFPTSIQNSQCPQITFNEKFGRLFGYEALSTPKGTTDFSIFSTRTPIYQYTQSIVCGINMCDNNYNLQAGIIHSIPLDVPYQELIIDQPRRLEWHRIIQGSYNFLVLTLYDQNFDWLTIADKDVTFSFLIKGADE